MTDQSLKSQTLDVRKFNRFHTRLVGALDEGLLKSDFSLVQVRLMYELNHNDNLAAADLMEILKLDRGYLSRLIASLEEKNLIKKTPDPKNGKRNLAVSSSPSVTNTDPATCPACSAIQQRSRLGL
jgi:DNA-binding MarR family transcriptional regulator